MDKNQNINQSLKYPSPTAQSNNSNDHSPQTDKLNKFPIMDSYQHQIAIQIISKIATRRMLRKFMKNLTFTYIFKLKQDKQQIRTVYITNTPQNSHNINWPYRQLFYKRNKSYQQQEMMDFVNHCATMIQSNFKRYIIQKRHKIAQKKYKKVKNAMLNFVKLWKAKRIYNCKRCHQIKLKFRQIQQQIDQQYEKPRIDNKKLQLLNQYLQFNASMFRDTYQKLYSNGMWILQQNMKPMIRKTKKIQYKNTSYNNFMNENDKKQQYHQQKLIKPKRVRQFRMKKIQNQQQNQYLNINSNFHSIDSKIQERPIIAKGQYVYNQQEIQQFQRIAKQQQIKKQKNKQQNRQDNKKIGNPNKNIQMQKLKKRQKYDPRKAIEEDKKKKKTLEPNQQVEKKVPSKVKTENNFIKEQKTPKKKKIALNKSKKEGNKKVESQVDCWINTKKQSDKQWVKQIKQRLTKQMEQQKQQQEFIQQSKRLVVKNQKEKPKKYQYIKNQQQIQALERQQFEQRLRKNQSRGQLKNQVRQMVQRTNINRKKQAYRPVQELQETYNKHYGDRYQNLMPKLGLLSVARGTQHDSDIPVIDSYSQSFNSQLKDILIHAKFWQIATRMQKTFKQFIVE